eukprot:486836-Prymnesium_polylepis.1
MLGKGAPCSGGARRTWTESLSWAPVSSLIVDLACDSDHMATTSLHAAILGKARHIRQGASY